MKEIDPGYGPTERPRTPMIKEMDALPGMSHSGNSFPSSGHKTHMYTAEGAPVQHKSPVACVISSDIGLCKRHPVNA